MNPRDDPAPGPDEMRREYAAAWRAAGVALDAVEQACPAWADPRGVGTFLRGLHARLGTERDPDTGWVREWETVPAWPPAWILEDHRNEALRRAWIGMRHLAVAHGWAGDLARRDALRDAHATLRDARGFLASALREAA